MSAPSCLADLFFPPKCILCGKLLSKEEHDLCAGCWKTHLNFPYNRDNPLPKGKVNLRFLDSLTAIWYYDGDVRRSILRYKFYRTPRLANPFGRLLGERITSSREIDCVTWVPVSTLRRIRRGYDQSELLARALAKELRLPVAPLLKKVRHTPAQSGISSPEARRANVIGAFRPAGKASAVGKQILLVDDIYTTGATAEECAKVLKFMGAAQVHLAAIAAAHKTTQKN